MKKIIKFKKITGVYDVEALNHRHVNFTTIEW